MAPFLSIIIPAHNEESRLPSTLEAVFDFLGGQPYSAEVIVVDNASHDRTAEIARAQATLHPNLRVESQTVIGKGAAVRAGILAARGDFRFICDADLSMPIQEIRQFLPPALDGFDVAIGSRELPGSSRHDEPAYRHWIGRAFNTLVRWMAIPAFQDTQCGFKCFRGEVAEELFRQQRLDGWTFDVEVLFLALRRGYRVVEVPISWYYVPGSRVRVIADSFAMFFDLIRIRRNWNRGLYA
ncbi:MAG: dolichyl-phosphate beta-glucosyltransferase [Anaerolineales bacterium]